MGPVNFSAFQSGNHSVKSGGSFGALDFELFGGHVDEEFVKLPKEFANVIPPKEISWIQIIAYRIKHGG